MSLGTLPGALNHTQLKKTKIKPNFIKTRAYPISLEPKNRNRIKNQINT